MRSRRRLAVWGSVAAVGLAVLGIWLTSSGSSTAAKTAHPTSDPSSVGTAGQTDPTGKAAAPASTRSPTANAQPAVGAQTLVAAINPAGAPGSATPGGPSTIEVPGQWLGAASILPVIAQQSGWYEVRLAQRPNESVAWVRARDLSLSIDYYHIVIDLSTTHLLLYDHGQQIRSFPAGIGIPSDPTPTGHFFVAFFARAPSPGYGAFVMVTSAHSNTISDWEESGDAIAAIHGPLGSDAAIGTTGAMVSHGCIRLHNVDLDQLRDVPAGTPIDITG